MINETEDTINLTQSPSITHETKARFNQLLSSALTKETPSELEVAIKDFPNDIIPATHRPNKQSKYIPKAVPRKKTKSNNQEVHILDKSTPTDSVSKFQKEVIADVHSSRGRLLLSSSDDDFLAENKEKKKRRKFKLKKQATEVNKLSEEGEDNNCFKINENHDKSSPSRLSNRSYTVDTPTFPLDEIKLLAEGPRDNISLKDNSWNKINQRSTVVVKNSQTPQLTSPKKDDFSKEIKTKLPIPLPRNKSIKPRNGTNEKEILENINDVPINVFKTRNTPNDTIIRIYDTSCQETEDDLALADVQQLQGSVEHSEDDGGMPIAIKKVKQKKKRGKIRERFELNEITSNKQDETFKEESSLQNGIDSIASDVLTSEEAHPNTRQQVVGVTIHLVDSPVVDPLVSHPIVRLFIVDTSTGEYYAKSDPSRFACYFEENTTYIPPIMTHPFQFKMNRSLQPVWEECLLINETPPHILSPHTLLLFELCDFLPASIASRDSRYQKLGRTAAWHTVAWAFLRLTSLNMGTRLRLQLFKPSKQPKTLRSCTTVVYDWWGNAVREKFPGSLHVTVAGVERPTTSLSPQLRSHSALQIERGSTSAASVMVSEDNSDSNCGQEPNATVEEIMWSRMPVQSCKVPNCKLQSLPVDGCMSVEFSGCGRWLACARQDVMIFSVPQFVHTCTLFGHQGLVYCLRWSSDSRILLSASADCTVCVWRPKHHSTPFLQLLAHPSFVYCAQFVHTHGVCTIVSGCYDGLLRLWQGEDHSSYQLTQEVTATDGYVTAICVTVDGDRVVAADSQGFLRVYEVDEVGRLNGGHELRVREVRGKIISNILTHPGGHRLLVHTRDSLVRSVDIATGTVIQTFKGGKNDRMQTGMCVSACGSLVFACGEDGSVTVWNCNTGCVEAVYCTILSPGSATIHYHPHDHILAVGALAQPPLYILKFDRNSTGDKVGLKTVGCGRSVLPTIIKSTQDFILSEDTYITRQKKEKEVDKRSENVPTSSSPSCSKWPVFLPFEYCEDKTEDKDLRLLEIIKKMDSIIIAAKQSSQPLLF